MYKNIYRNLILFLILILSFSTITAQETDETKREAVRLEDLSIGGSRGYSGAFKKSNAASSTGLSKNLRYTVHDGNLVTGGVINTGLLSYHYVSGTPYISWPKGSSSVEYLHGAVFYVAAEVIDERGDTIHIVSDNYRRGGEIALDQSHFYGFGALPKFFNNHQPNAIDWDTPGISEDVGLDGIPNSNDEGEGDGILQDAEDFNGNEKLDLSLQNGVGWFAVSHKRETWPVYWPAGCYPGDDRSEGEEREGVRAGRWNGEFGAYIRSDQESYYQMDDRENDEFAYYPFEDEDSKQDYPHGKRGLGLTVEVRNYQWNSRLAEDILISIYDVENKGKDLDKCVVGMYVDPDLGGASSGDNASFDDIDDITYAFNKAGVASSGLPIGYFGFAFLESPGLASDGIDNDQDGMVDESQNNGIDDDGDWRSWEDENGNGIWDNEDTNHNGILDVGEDVNENGKLDIEPLSDDLGSDGLGPEFDEYTGPDADGTEANGIPDIGEPNFEFTDNDESDQVGLTSFYLRDVDNTMANDEKYWQVEISPNTYTTRPGYQRDIAWSYGSGYVQFVGNENIHRYAISLLFGNNESDILRNKKTMQVIYDEDYNFSKPPKKPVVTATGGDNQVVLQWDKSAERSRDPIYGFDFEAYYIYKSTDPTFTDIRTITDAYGNALLMKPIAIFDIDNTLSGIHPVSIGSEISSESDLGVSYNMGTNSGLKHSYVDTDVTNGRSYYYAVVSVDRGYHPDFYPELTDKENLLTISPTECSATIQTDLLGRPTSTESNTVIVIPVEHPSGWIEPELDEDDVIHTEGIATSDVKISVYDENIIKNNTTYRIEFTDDGSLEKYGDAYTGLTETVKLYNETEDYSIKSISEFDNDNEDLAEFIAEGIQIHIVNDTITVDTSYWSNNSINLAMISSTQEDNGIPVPRDYEVRVLEMGADTSVNSGGIPTNFQIWDVTDEDNNFKVKFRYSNNTQPAELKGILSDNDKIQIVSQFSNIKRLWIFNFRLPDSVDAVNPEYGDILTIITKKSFDRNDVYHFTVNGNYIETKKAKSDLDNIYVVPDPYVAVSSLERKVINEDEGRGDRRIDFVNLPNKCKISIFTTSGRLVRTLDHLSETDFSRQSWDLRTSDGLEIAPGIYFYVVEAEGIGEKAGRFAIIK